MWKGIVALAGAGAALYAAQYCNLIDENISKALAVLAGTGITLFGANKLYFSGGKCYETGRLDGKLVVVTGASAGIGKETVSELARRGAKVIMACRNIEKAEEAKADIIANYGKGMPTALTKHVLNSKIRAILTPVESEQLVIEKLDLASFRSIRAFVQRIRNNGLKIDALINNAGVMACPYEKTEDGIEMQIGTNYLGHFLLTELLLPEMNQNSKASKIIFLSSTLHLYTKVIDTYTH